MRAAFMTLLGSVGAVLSASILVIASGLRTDDATARSSDAHPGERALSAAIEVEREAARAERLLVTAARELTRLRAQGSYGLPGPARATIAQEPWILALEWLPTVPASARGRYEEGRGQDWGALPSAGAPLRILEPGPRIRSAPGGGAATGPRFAGARSEYHPLTLIECPGVDPDVLGTDLGVLPEVAAAMAHSRASGEPALASPTPFVEREGGPSTVLRLLVAVRAPPRNLGIAVDETSPEARGEGFLALVLDPARLAASIAARAGAGHPGQDPIEVEIAGSGVAAPAAGRATATAKTAALRSGDRAIEVSLGGRALPVTARAGDGRAGGRVASPRRSLVALQLLAVASLAAAVTALALAVSALRRARAGGAVPGRAAQTVVASPAATPIPEQTSAAVAGAAGTEKMEERIGALRDALAHSEERARAIFGAVPDAMYRIMRDRRVIDCKAHGFKGLSTPSSSLTVRQLNEIFPDAIVPEVESLFARVVAERSVEVLRYSAPSIAASRGVGPRHYEARLAPLGSGEVLALVRDTTQQAELDRVKQEFLAEVSHELKTPLTSTLGALDLLARSYLTTPGAARDLLEIARSGADRIKSLVSDLLDLERMAHGRLTFDLRDVAPEEVVRPVVLAHKAAALADGVAISTEVAPETPAVRVDARRVVQVLSNLVENATRFAPEGSTVFVRVAREASGRVRFSVLDRGPGIPEEQQARLFQRFVQLEQPRRPRRGGSGSGLGLAVAKGLVEAQGGRIGLVSKVGLGSTFWFELPVATGDGGPGTPPGSTSTPPGPGAR